jgi:hypothetical protein
VQRPCRRAAGNLGVALARLRQRGGTVLQRHDGVDPRIEPLDVIEIGAHDLDAGDAPRADRGREADRVHHDDVRRTSAGRRLAAIGLS